jgi:siderophore synthetase component
LFLSKTLASHLMNDEQEIYCYLERNHPDLVEMFLRQLEKSRLGIIQRLLQGIIREGLIKEERILWNDAPSHKELRIHISEDKWLQAKVTRRFQLQQFDIEEIFFVHEKKQEAITSPAHLLKLLEQEGMIAGYPNQERFYKELENSAANYALALTAGEYRTNQLHSTNSEKSTNSIQWVLAEKQRTPSFSPLAFYEQWVIDGHTIHPCSKTKFGFNPEEVMNYSPEWEAKPIISFIAVKRSDCHITSFGFERVADLLYEEYPELKQHVTEELGKKGLKENEYDLIPVHPWQLEHTIPKLYKEAMKNGSIIPIPSYSIETYALVSIRTLMPTKNGKHHIKTPMNVQTTSAVRTVSPASTINGPIVSQLIKNILQKEPLLSPLDVIKEKAGIYFEPTNPSLFKHDTSVLGKNLAAIIRENPEYDLEDGEIAMPAVALIAVSPVSGKPIVVELIEEYARYQNIEEINQAVVAFIKQYASVLLPGLLTLMSKYGISLEAHLQNSVPIFQNGALSRMKVRDFGGIRIYVNRLEKQGLSANLFNPSMIITNDVTELRKTLSHAIIHNHLGEIIACLVRYFSIDEELLWKEIAIVIHDVFDKLKTNETISEQVSTDEQAFFKPTLEMKALVTMRLTDDIHNSFIDVPNPLAKWKGELEK